MEKQLLICVLDFDDVMEQNPFPMNELEMLARRYPKFKVNLFAVPGCNPQWNDKPYIKWCVHGLKHDSLECEKWSKASLIYLDDLDPRYSKIFRAPNWSISDEALDGLIERGYIVCLHQKRDTKPEYRRKIYRIDKSPPMICTDGLKPQLIHGHISNCCGNGIRETMYYLMRMPEDTTFLWIDEFMEKYEGDR